jgi:hypothetical protein
LTIIDLAVEEHAAFQRESLSRPLVIPVVLFLANASNLGMVRRTKQIGLLLLVLVSGLHAGSSGTFRGTLVSAPGNPSELHWIYVKGKNGVIRRVEVSSAKVLYSENVPRDQRKQSPTSVLQPGTEIRVTASQNSKGAWRASRIEILSMAEPAPPADSEDNEDSNSTPSLPENTRLI